MSCYSDINPQDIDPETGRPYSNYSSASLDTSFHDAEMNVADSEDSLLSELAALDDFDPEFEAEEAADTLNRMIERARALTGRKPGASGLSARIRRKAR